MTDWMNNITEEEQSDRELIPLSQLDESDELEVVFEDTGQYVDTKFGRQVRFSVKLEAHEGDLIEGNEDETPLTDGEHYAILTGSKRFLREVKAVAEENSGDLAGIAAVISSNGKEDFDRRYTVTES